MPTLKHAAGTDAGIAPGRGLGRLLPEEPTLLDQYQLQLPSGGGGGGPVGPTQESTAFTPYELVDTAPAALQTVGGDAVALPKSTLPLPRFDFATGVAACTDCATGGATTNSALAPSPARVTPLPAVPTPTNWLLWGGLAVLGLVIYKSHSPALNGPAEDADAPAPPDPTLQTLGRPAAPKKRTVAKLTIS